MPEPTPETELKPIPKPTIGGPAFEITDKPVPVPEMVTHFSKWDYFCMGARRTLKAGIYFGAAALAVSGVGIMFGVPFLLALKGSALMVVSGSIAMGAGKIAEEKIKEKNETPAMEILICMIITAIIMAIQAMNKKKGGTK
jgi:hypothetical protein